MKEVSLTRYIPLYGKALVSRRGLILKDEMAERIWENVSYPLKGRAVSKWLAYFMGMRACVFDDWVGEQLTRNPDALVLHLGCGLDSRATRVNRPCSAWYDVDTPEVIQERRQYFHENVVYHMLGADVTDGVWLDQLPHADAALVVMEGLSMYLPNARLAALFDALQARFARVSILLDVYTPFGARASRFRNPINEVGAMPVYGVADPMLLTSNALAFVREHSMTPERLVRQLHGMERAIFNGVYARNTRRVYRLYEYASHVEQ